MRLLIGELRRRRGRRKKYGGGQQESLRVIREHGTVLLVQSVQPARYCRLRAALAPSTLAIFMSRGLYSSGLP